MAYSAESNTKLSFLDEHHQDSSFSSKKQDNVNLSVQNDKTFIKLLKEVVVTSNKTGRKSQLELQNQQARSSPFPS